MKTMTHIALAAVLASSFAAEPSRAADVSAQTADAPRLQEKVTYDDLNLESPAGAKVLLSRLRGAARDVCEPLTGFGVDGHVRWQACFDKAMADAVAAIDKPSVTAAFRSEQAATRG